jgi:hypothetical protein
MGYCAFSGRTVKDGDVFCANCARKLFLALTGEAVPSGLIGLCPKCHGRGVVELPDGKGRVLCDYPGCPAENKRLLPVIAAGKKLIDKS